LPFEIRRFSFLNYGDYTCIYGGVIRVELISRVRDRSEFCCTVTLSTRASRDDSNESWHPPIPFYVFNISIIYINITKVHIIL
jgi:hypothetical protein